MHAIHARPAYEVKEREPHGPVTHTARYHNQLTKELIMGPRIIRHLHACVPPLCQLSLTSRSCLTHEAGS
ncbi:hypothetical protein GCM10007863_02290 [Dyella mobilis]|nr:hypothetical protein GCM10007863_02290 [Dyella mobilis]